MNIRTASGHFWINFGNGYELSVFNGYGSHTENNFATDKWNNIIKSQDIFAHWDSKEVEIAIIDTNNGELITDKIIQSRDTVKTVNIKELINIMNLLLNKG